MIRPALTSEARHDLRQIGSSSLRSFGPAQARRHLQRMDAAFLDLVAGRRRGRVILADRPLDLCLLVGVHYVVYRVRQDDRLLIVRILHSRMDLSSHLCPMTMPSFSLRIPKDDSLPRKVCDACGFVAYENPKIVVGSVVRHEGRILLCKRAIAPRRGFWTIPAGYMELNETPEAGARREAMEEAGASLAISRLLAVYSVPRISQVQLIFRATLADPAIAAGPESEAVALWPPEEIPWDALAFPSVHWALRHDAEAEAGAAPIPFGNPEGAEGDRMPDGARLAAGEY